MDDWKVAIAGLIVVVILAKARGKAVDTEGAILLVRDQISRADPNGKTRFDKDMKAAGKIGQSIDTYMANANVKAFLALIRKGEGTEGIEGYSMHYGGDRFEGWNHPRATKCRWGRCSTAAGAYQILGTTWDELVRFMGLKDFSPSSQDRAALGLIAARKALSDVVNGNIGAALAKCSWEWASIPPSRYGQGKMTVDDAVKHFVSAGGMVS